MADAHPELRELRREIFFYVWKTPPNTVEEFLRNNILKGEVQ